MIEDIYKELRSFFYNYIKIYNLKNNQIYKYITIKLNNDIIYADSKYLCTHLLILIDKDMFLNIIPIINENKTLINCAKKIDLKTINTNKICYYIFNVIYIMKYIYNLKLNIFGKLEDPLDEIIDYSNTMCTLNYIIFEQFFSNKSELDLYCSSFVIFLLNHTL